MRVEPKAIVRTLTQAAKRMMEAAAGKSVAAQHYSVDPEHLLLAMLEEPAGDVPAVLSHFEIRVADVRSEVEQVLAHTRSGNQGRPAISEHIFNWIEDAWLTSSLTLGQTRVRSGALLLQVLLEPGRYGMETPPGLRDLDVQRLKREFAAITGESSEAQEATAAAASGHGAAPSAPVEGGALDQFTTDFTAAAKAGGIDPIFGRDREIRQVIDILSRRRKNNPVIVGEPGVGKTALVEGLALAIAHGEVPESLANVRLVGLDLGALQAGASVKGEFERRLKAVIDEVKASPIPVILFIDEAHTLIGAGGAQGTSDAANLLKPALARGELRTVAATTWAEYKKYFEKDAALERRFQAVKVDEPTEENAIVMLRGLRDVYESSHGVTIRDEAVEAAVRLSHRYVTGRQLPDKAVDLLDTAAARVRVERKAKPEAMTLLETQLAATDRAITALRRDVADGVGGLSDTLAELEGKRQEQEQELQAVQERWEQQRALLHALLDARGAVLEASAADPVDEAQVQTLQAAAHEAAERLRAIEPEEALLSADLDAEGVARTLASWTGIPVGRMRRGSIDAVLKLQETLEQKVIGQNPAMETLAQTMRVAHAKIRDPNTPVGVLLFVGPSGVGKTETAITLAEELYGGEQCMTTINMSEFQEKHTVSRLVGSPPGYVGYGEGGVLTEAVRRRPYSVVLLDECEKADLEVMNIFYQVFDKGVLNDGEGRAIDFRNTVIILTSNLATDLIMDEYAEGATPSAEEVIERIRPTLSRHFQPALLARMTIVPFRPISEDAMRSITALKVGKLQRRIEAAHGLSVELDDALIGQLAARCTTAETGARNIDHILRGSLMPALAGRLLEHMAEGEERSTLTIGLLEDGNWSLELA